MNNVSEANCDTVIIESNATMSIGDVGGIDTFTLASSSYEFIEGSPESPYIIPSSMCK